SMHIADRLEARGWIGHFFITTDRIGYRAFLSAGEIGELHQRGHIVGSHSHTHPERMWALTQAELVNEWATSSAILADHLGAPVTVASVPGGFYRRRVAEAAAEAGLCVLFTSEPSTRLTYVDGCAVLGRFNVDGRSSPTAAAGIAGGDRLPRLRQWAHWNAKKVAKTVAGNSYAAVRRMVLGS
ncbi:MAG: polysaccharide deacetylase family protein, partial [Gemmatimonadetes bacterium]|nr:polysaccharide deacetylase family protein [Gemmatimonadota bacterium]